MNGSPWSPYRRIWTAGILSAIGTGMTGAAMPLVASREPRSELALGVIGAAAVLPGVLLAVPAGLLADRHDRARIMVAADLGRALVVAVTATLVAIGRVPWTVLAGIMFLIGAGETVFVTASQSTIPSLFPLGGLDRANGQLQAADDAGREFVGPPIGSLTFAAAAWIPFLGDACSYLVSAALLVRLPRDATRTGAPDGTPTDRATRPTMGPAWAYFRTQRTLVVLSGALFTLALCGSAVLAMLVLVVRDRLGLSAKWFGPSLTVVAIGATLAAVAVGRIRMRLSARAAMCAAVTVNAAAYVVLGTTRHWPVAAAAMLAWGFAVTVGNIVSIGIRQRSTPSELLGRVMGIFRVALGAGGVIGALASGALARATSVGTVATVAGVLQLPVAAALALGIGTSGGAAQQPATR